MQTSDVFKVKMDLENVTSMTMKQKGFFFSRSGIRKNMQNKHAHRYVGPGNEFGLMSKRLMS